MNPVFQFCVLINIIQSLEALIIPCSTQCMEILWMPHSWIERELPLVKKLCAVNEGGKALQEEKEQFHGG